MRMSDLFRFTNGAVATTGWQGWMRDFHPFSIVSVEGDFHGASGEDRPQLLGAEGTLQGVELVGMPP